ncbi:hypothetical protein C437_12231 [Haloarcula vallismortis ATCC 29715]|uniref:Uncharacterized protein n=1 Tax=Haloarcula vallismortis ATCC 29715 TaxID=662477 RepID=M0JEQ7_HALVA|nr:hypothetical protein C437_12231 [Haloarcula vallismortis ATCC 29715]
MVSLQDLDDRLISLGFLYLMVPATVLYLDLGVGVLAVFVSYLFFAAWAWVTEGVSTGDVAMLLMYGLTTANTPVLGLQVLLFTAGSTIITVNQLTAAEDIPFAPVFLISYLVTQTGHLWLLA